jgi:hypothetical protein
MAKAAAITSPTASLGCAEAMTNSAAFTGDQVHIHNEIHIVCYTGFISEFCSRGGKHMEANFKGGGESHIEYTFIGKASFQGGGGESTPWPP